MSGKRILVTGAAGFTGRHLVEWLGAQEGLEVIGVARRAHPGGHAYDLTCYEEMTRLLQATRPDFVYHCAGAFTNHWDIDLAANVVTSRNLLEAVRELDFSCRVLLLGTAAEYGRPPVGPVPETAPLRPVSTYGLTKTLQSALMEFHHRQHGLDVVMARPFNLLGAGCSPVLFPGRVLEQIAQFKAGAIRAIEVGSLESKRDYLPVERAVVHYTRIMRNGRAGETYNVGSGVPSKLTDVLAGLLAAAGLDLSVVKTVPRADRLRPDVSEVYADIRKLESLPPA